MAQKIPLWMTISMIAVLGVATVALSYLALTRVASEDNEGLPIKSGARTALGTAVGFPDPEPGSSSEPLAEPINMMNSSRMLAAADGLVVRATAGTCENPGTVEFSEDTGQNWRASESLVEVGATQVLRILPTEQWSVEAVALDGNCDPQLYRTENLGATWVGPLAVEGTWYLDPSHPDVIGTPDGLQPSPCQVVSLAATGDRAAALCGDGTIKVTNDRAVSWLNTTKDTDALAINYSEDSYTVALAGDDTCAGVRLSTLSGGDPLPLGCFQTELNSDALNLGSIVLTQSGELILLWAGDRFATSTDMGTTWL